ncbi:hypothetical protein Cgig2_027106 [Carnegiea gigantea]|uniref:GT-1/4-like C-terminal domain-containing protein n=1 Tax=Carnegiea gigantea TaxID=171969 RepID=A0A9Q1KA65_9CARY|nr:hypothetical protein Cgig2_027106 [Carnegiea gigantea]
MGLTQHHHCRITTTATDSGNNCLARSFHVSNIWTSFAYSELCEIQNDLKAENGVRSNERPTLNLERRLDHEGHPLAITAADAVTGGGVPPSFWRDAGNALGSQYRKPGRSEIRHPQFPYLSSFCQGLFVGTGDDGHSYGGRVITVKLGDYTRRVGVDGTADAIKDVIRSLFGIRTRRAFWLEDEDQVARSLDRDMPPGTYTLRLDEGMTIKLCHYEESDHIPYSSQTISHAEEWTFYSQDEFREFLHHRGWSCLRELNGYRNIANLDDLRPDVLYRGVT